MKEENKQKLREFLRKTKIETASKKEAIFVQDLAIIAGMEYSNEITEEYVEALYFYMGNNMISYNSEIESFMDHSYREITMFELFEFYHSLVINEYDSRINAYSSDSDKLGNKLEIANIKIEELISIISKIATKKFLKKHKNK